MFDLYCVVILLIHYEYSIQSGHSTYINLNPIRPLKNGRNSSSRFVLCHWGRFLPLDSRSRFSPSEEHPCYGKRIARSLDDLTIHQRQQGCPLLLRSCTLLHVVFYTHIPSHNTNHHANHTKPLELCTWKSNGKRVEDFTCLGLRNRDSDCVT